MIKVKAFAPASYSNLSVGFDILGLALRNLGDIVELEQREDSAIHIKSIFSEVDLPEEVDKNCCSIVIKKMQEACASEIGCDIIIRKGFKAGSGLGSSSASSVAAAVAYNALLGSPFVKEDLLEFALEGEFLACGARHADNVAPSLFGGLIMVRSYEPLDIISLPVPSELYAVTLFPDVEVKTSESRKLLPKQVDLSVLTKQVANMAGFISALYEEDYDRIADCLVDHVAEPGRKSLIPHFDEMKKAAMDMGALCFGISGSGPTVFSLTDNASVAEDIKGELESIFANSPIQANCFVEKLEESEGAHIIL